MSPPQNSLSPLNKPSGSELAPILVGLIGAGIARSLTPAMQQTEAAAQGLALDYRLIDLDVEGRRADDLPALLDRAQAEGYAGLNITYPCKQAVIPLLDGLSEQAQAIGAVNTVLFRAGRTWGDNTDSSGWRWGFERSLPGAALNCVVLLGAGGAGAAIAHALMVMGVGELRLVDSDNARAQALASRLNALYRGTRAVASASAASALAGAAGLVHATPTGMDKLPGMPLPASLLQPGLWVSEIVYFPLDTALLQAARARGLRVSDGGHMAVGQAVGAFEQFTGRKADADRMNAHLRRLIKERK